MRQFYTMHEHIYTEIRECKKINKISLLTKNTQTKPNIIIRQKQSLVHKVPSGVAILSHVRDVAAIVHPQKNINVMGDGGYIYLVNVGRQGIRCLLAVKNGVGVAT